MRKPDEKKYRIAKHWRFARMSRKIPLRFVAEFSGYSLQYLRSIEACQDTISDSVVKAYEKTIKIIEKNRKKATHYEKLCDK